MKTEAQARLELAWDPTSVDKSGSFMAVVDAIHDRVEVLIDNPGRAKIVLSKSDSHVWVEGQNPKYDRTYWVCSPTRSMFPTGFLALQRNEYGELTVTGTYVAPKFQGLGLGRMLYDAAIKDMGKLASDMNLSQFSSSLWASLAKTYRVVYHFPKGLGPNGKAMDVKIVGWEKIGKMTYPVFKMQDGSTKTLKQLLKWDPDRSGDSPTAASDGYYVAYAK
jgi:GNAT superfamily N-acetyltransferase